MDDRDRVQLIADIYEVIAESKAIVFGVALEKEVIDGDCYERAFEEIVSRFDKMLGRFNNAPDRDAQRGLIVVAESAYRQNIELLARRIAREGHRWGGTKNLADIPYFAPAGSTRLRQLADFVANAVHGRYEKGYARDFDRIGGRFDFDGGRVHSLVHRSRGYRNCSCPACVIRRTAPGPAPLDE